MAESDAAAAVAGGGNGAVEAVDAVAAADGLVHLRGLRCHAWPMEAAAAAVAALSLMAAE